MALHVTQCPSCESSFNTSAAMLKLAEGKVRCGSCLTVFHAIDNFVESTVDEDSQDEGSVFVGNSPEDYFNPAVFLTRSALQQNDETELDAETEESDTSQQLTRDDSELFDSSELGTEPPISEDSLELSEEYTNEFFEAIEHSMEESLREAENEKDALIRDLQASETSFFEDFQAPLLSESESLSPELFPDSSDQLTDPFAPRQEALTAESDNSEPDNDVFELNAENNVEGSGEEQDQTEEFGEHTITETQTPQPPEDLFSESVEQPEDEELPLSKTFIAHSITEIHTPNSTQAANSTTAEDNIDKSKEAASQEVQSDIQDQAMESPTATEERQDFADEGLASSPQYAPEEKSPVIPDNFTQIDREGEQEESEEHSEEEAEEAIEGAEQETVEDRAKTFVEKTSNTPLGAETNQSPPNESSSANLPPQIEAQSKPEDLQLSVSFSMQRAPIVKPTITDTDANETPKLETSQSEAEVGLDAGVETGLDQAESEEPYPDAPVKTDIGDVQPAASVNPDILQSHLEAESAEAESAEEESATHSESEESNLGDTPLDSPDQLEEELNQEIAEHDFKESIAEGLENPESEFADALFGSRINSQQSKHSIDEETQIDSHHEEAEPENLAPEQDPLTVSETEESEENFTPSILGNAGHDAAENEELAEPSIEDSTEEIRARALDAEFRDDAALETIPEENIAALDVSSTPVELLAGQQSHWGKRIAYGILAILLGSGLGSQYLWHNMVAYSQDVRIRPFYELACSYTSCNLPEYSSVTAIRSDTLEVRSHPQLENGLIVNIEFRNTAPFPQAFPIMILSFNSATNDIVALREFSPAEYLDPGLREITMMPSMSPVQVNLEIIDPGPGAVNYTLAFRLP